MKEYKTIVNSIVFQKETYYIISCEIDGKKSSVLGNCAYQINRGEEIKFTARPTQNKYGTQYKTNIIEVVMPTEKDLIIEYLKNSKIRGLGGATAEKIYDAFGSKTFEVIDDNPEALRIVSGIGVKRIKQIIDDWKEKRNGPRIIEGLITRYKFSTQKANRLYEKYNDKALSIISTSPFTAYQEEVISFKEANSIHLMERLDRLDPIRLLSGMVYALENACSVDGHCSLPVEEVMNFSQRTLYVKREDLEEITCIPAFSKIIKLILIGDVKHYQLFNIHEIENRISSKIHRMLNAEKKDFGSLSAKVDKEIELALEKQGIPISDEQRKAIFESLNNNVNVISGGPGVGKTTIANQIISIIKKNKFSCTLLAPTGRAAKRMTETTGEKAKTIHRLIAETEGQSFKSDFIIVDEFSMVDIFIFESLLSIVGEETNLIIIGDVNQIMSIGAGCVLRDIIDSGVVNVSRVEQIRRQSKGSNIISNAYKVNSGEMIEKGSKDDDFMFIETRDDKTTLEFIKRMMAENIYKAFGINPKTEVQILTTLHGGNLGSIVINKMMQDMYNGDSKQYIEFGGKRFYVGDNVIQNENDYERMVFNGDTGYIKAINSRSISVVYPDSSDDEVMYLPEHYGQIDLSYAITPFKAQGSEYPFVIIPISYQENRLLDASLLFTGITRGSQKVVVIGSKNQMMNAIKRNRSNFRHTTLKDKLRNTFVELDQQIIEMEKHLDKNIDNEELQEIEKYLLNHYWYWFNIFGVIFLRLIKTQKADKITPINIIIKNMGKRNIFNFLFSFFIMFIGTTLISDNYIQGGVANAAVITTDELERKEESCGIDGNGDIVSKSYSICKEDLSYNVLYMSFTKVFNEFPILKSFLYDEAPSLSDKGYSASMGGSTIAIISGFSYLVLFFGSLLIVYATVKVIYLSAGNGQFLTGSINRRWMIIRSVAIMFAIVPVPTFSLAQLSVFIVAMLSIMGGNFFHSTFLANLQEESVNIDPEDYDLVAKANSFSGSLVNAGLCQIRTSKALVSSSIFNQRDRNIFLAPKFSEQIKRMSSCISPEGKYSFNEGSKYHNISAFYKDNFVTGNVESVSLTNRTLCNSRLGIKSDYDKTEHGDVYSCGSIAYAIPTIAEIQDDVSSGAQVSESKYRKLIDNAVVSSYNSYNLSGKLAQYEALSKSTNGGKFEFKDNLAPFVQEFKNSIISGGESVYNTAEGEKGHKLAVKMTYLYFNLLAANLLGAKSENGEKLLTYSNKMDMFFSDMMVAKPSDSFGIISRVTNGAAFRLDSYNCVNKFDQFQEATSATYQSISQNKNQKYKDFAKNGTYFGECIWFVDDRNDSALDYGDVSTIQNIDDETKFFITAGKLSGKYRSFDIERDSDGLSEEIQSESIRLINEANDKKNAVASHYYVVLSAISEAFAEVLAEQTDKELPKKMRKQGWATLGSLILSLTSNHINATSYLQGIKESISWSAEFDPEPNSLFINEQAFRDQDENKLQVLKDYKTIDLTGFFGSHGSSDVSYTVITGDNKDEESSMLQVVYDWMENGITKPMKYIKDMGGLDKNLTIRAGVEKCYKEGNCSTGDTHPVSAMVYMGSDLLDFSISYFIVYGIVKPIAALSSISNDPKKKKNAGKISAAAVKLIPGGAIVSAILKIVEVVHAIMSIFAPFVFLIMIMGLFFAYMLPLMPYMMYLMQIVGWLVLIYTMLVSVPIWLLMIFVPSSTGEPRGDTSLIWQYVAQLIFRPAFVVMGLIIGWYMSSVLIYIVNMTFFGVMSVIGETSSGFIRSIVDVIMFYVVYLIIVLVVLKYSFQLITSFPDLASKAIQIKDATDPNARSATNDRLLTALAIKQYADQVQGSASVGYSTAIDAATKGKREEMQKQQYQNAAEDVFNNKFRDQFGGDPNAPVETPSERNAEGSGVNDSASEAANNETETAETPSERNTEGSGVNDSESEATNNETETARSTDNVDRNTEA